MDELDKKVYQNFAGRVVQKGATKLVKGFSNVPTYVLEYLLGTYCTSDSQEDIDSGIEQVKQILSNNYVRNDEVELIRTRIRDNGTYNVIDVVNALLHHYFEDFCTFFFRGQAGHSPYAGRAVAEYRSIV